MMMAAMTMLMIMVRMMMMVIMTVAVTVMVLMILGMLVPLTLVADVRVAWILAENQRLDRYRNRLRRQPHAAQINVIEIPQHHAVDHQKLIGDVQFIAQNCAQRLRNIAVEHHKERPTRSDRVGKTARNSLGEATQPFIGRRPAPTQGKRDFAIAVGQIESDQMLADGPSQRVGLDDFLAEVFGLNNLQIPPRQQNAGIGNVARVSAELHTVGGGAQRRRPDAFAGRQ